MKVKIEKRKVICPVCHEEMVKGFYFGSEELVVDKHGNAFVHVFEGERCVLVVKD